MLRGLESGPRLRATNVRAVIHRDQRYLLARYTGMRSGVPALWTLPRIPGPDSDRVLRDALWHDFGLGLRTHRPVGLFDDAVDGTICLVVDAEVIGEATRPDATGPLLGAASILSRTLGGASDASAAALTRPTCSGPSPGW